jgi:hypothetical protein
MYYGMIAALMVALPIASILIESMLPGAAPLVHLVGKWFAFWAVGVRLLLAGSRQIFNPAFTAETIFETRDPGALKIVPELGFANAALGMTALLTLLFPAWLLPVAVCGGLFFGMAGVKHIFNTHRNRMENVAMASDLWIAAVMAIYVGGTALS